MGVNVDKIDVLVTWPHNCDFPLWRNLMRIYRQMFNRVVIVFMEPNQGPDYREFVKHNLREYYVDFIDSPKIEPEQDWRSVAVNAGLERCTGDIIWFTEQDFFVINHDIFWPRIKPQLGRVHAVGLKEEASGRLHPACLFVRREVLDKTTKNFGVTPDGDHFARFTKDLEANFKVKTLKELQLTTRSSFLDPAREDWIHLNGLAHNHTLIHNKDYEGVYKPDIFKGYLEQCLALVDKGAEIPETWIKEAKDYLVWLKNPGV